MLRAPIFYYGGILGIMLCVTVVSTVDLSAEGAGDEAGAKTGADKGFSRAQRKDALLSFEELTRLLVALATGTLVLAPTVVSTGKRDPIRRRWALGMATSFLVVSLALGVLVLSALTGSQYHGDYDIALPMVVWLGRGQWICFAVGLILFCFFALTNISGREESRLDVIRAAVHAHTQLAQMSESRGDLARAEHHYRQVIELQGDLQETPG